MNGYEGGSARTAEPSLLLFGRQKLQLTGVEDVISFDETSVLLQTALGVLTVDGTGLHIVNFNTALQSGQPISAGRDAGSSGGPGGLTIEGEIRGMFYLDETSKPKRGMLHRRGNASRSS